MPPARPLLLFLVKLTGVVPSLLAPERAIGAPSTDGQHPPHADVQTYVSDVTTDVLVRRRRSRSGTTLRTASAAVGLALRFDVPPRSWTGATRPRLTITLAGTLLLATGSTARAQERADAERVEMSLTTFVDRVLAAHPDARMAALMAEQAADELFAARGA